MSVDTGTLFLQLNLKEICMMLSGLGLLCEDMGLMHSKGYTDEDGAALADKLEEVMTAQGFLDGS